MTASLWCIIKILYGFCRSHFNCAQLQYCQKLSEDYPEASALILAKVLKQKAIQFVPTYTTPVLKIVCSRHFSAVDRR
jgi:hypothetical protein